MVKSKLLEALKLAELESIRRGDPQRWSLARVARATGLNRSTVQRLMEEPQKCSVAVVEKVAQALGVGFDALLEVDPVDQGEQPAE